jgi:hypothetical protein
MDIRTRIIELLRVAVTDAGNRVASIEEFQRLVWVGGVTTAFAEPVVEKLRELAYDLSFYEPHPVLRQESDVYYDDDRAVANILPVLNRLERDDKIRIV